MHLSWCNPGGKRKKETRIPDMISGSFHVLLLQGAHVLIAQHIEDEFYVVKADAESCLAVGLRKTTFREPATGENVKLVTQTAGRSSGLAMLVVRAEFLRLWRCHDAEADVNHITVATLHLHNAAVGVQPHASEQLLDRHLYRKSEGARITSARSDITNFEQDTEHAGRLAGRQAGRQAGWQTCQQA